MRVDVIETPELGDRSYVVSDALGAVVIDPQRDLDRVDAVLEQLGVPVVFVLETHLHNDYVSGGLELATRCGAEYVVNGRDAVAFERHPAYDGERLQAGGLTITVLETPGHTATHLSYLIDDGQTPPAVFSGGSLLYGSVGRTDLIDPDRTEELTHSQWRSAHALADAVPDESAVYPTHGFGSFCSAGAGNTVTTSTIGEEKRTNMALTADDEDAFVRDLIEGLTAYPAYYAHMGARNAAGPADVDLTPSQHVEPGELAKRIADGEWVVDLRERRAYAEHHLAGTINMELGQQFATYLGWLMPWDSSLTLIGETPAQVADAQRQLVRIGIDHPQGAATGPVEELASGVELRTYPQATFADLAAAMAVALHNGDALTVVDVRREAEFAESHIAGALNVPLQSLLTRLGDLPHGPLWVHCAAGYRAGMAASLLDRAGRDVVHIDDAWSSAGKAFALTTPAGRSDPLS